MSARIMGLDPGAAREAARELLDTHGPQPLLVVANRLELRLGVAGSWPPHSPRGGWGPLAARILTELGAVRRADGRWGRPGIDRRHDDPREENPCT
jgi:hypothetical protein